MRYKAGPLWRGSPNPFLACHIRDLTLFLQDSSSAIQDPYLSKYLRPHYSPSSSVYPHRTPKSRQTIFIQILLESDLTPRSAASSFRIPWPVPCDHSAVLLPLGVWKKGDVASTPIQTLSTIGLGVTSPEAAFSFSHLRELTISGWRYDVFPLHGGCRGCSGLVFYWPYGRSYMYPPWTRPPLTKRTYCSRTNYP